MRVLKPSGSIWVNLGDKYSQRVALRRSSHQDGLFPSRSDLAKDWKRDRAAGLARMPYENVIDAATGQHVPEKSLMGLPWRYAIGCIDQLGLILRAEVVWSKPNGLPESCTDRVRRSHEQWFHLTKQPRYFSAVDEIREPHADVSVRRAMPHRANPGRRGHEIYAGQPGQTLDLAQMNHPLGRLPGSVWTIPTEPLTVPPELGVDHFACVDDATEILTRRGWLRHHELRTDDEVAGYGLDSGTTRWTRLHGIHRYDYDGELVAVDARGLSMRLTPNHRTLVHRFAGRHALRQPVEVIDAGDLTRQHAIPRAVEWVEDGRETSIGVDLSALLGWVASEGWVHGNSVYLSQSKTKNADHVATIDALLARLPGSYVSGNVYASRGKWRVRVMRNGARVEIGTFDNRGDAEQAAAEARGERDATYRTEREREWRGHPWTDVTWRLAPSLSSEVLRVMPDKLLAMWAADLPMAEARALLGAFVDGDGHRRADGRLSVFQKQKHNLDVLQVVAVRLGYNTTLRESGDRWVLYLSPPRPARLRGADGTSLVRRERYRGSVWCVSTGAGTFVARRHGSVFVTGNSFPTEWPRRLILGWSPPGICTACGEGRRPTVEKGYSGKVRGGHQARRVIGYLPVDRTDWQEGQAALVTGYVCACPTPDASTRPAVVLDPFGGTGTTALAASALGRIGISVDLSHDYSRIARWRIRDPAQRAKAMRVDKPPVQVDGQVELITYEEAAG